jgi:hypothetical protein
VLDSCSPSQKEPVVARVGSAELTRQEAQKNVDTTRGDIEGQIAAYAASWVNEELLYQEAKRNGLESSLQVVETLSRTRRQLAGQAYLRNALAEDTAQTTERMVEEYYQSHTSEFVVPGDMLQLAIATFVSRDRATAFTAILTKGEGWDRAVNLVQADSATGLIGAAIRPSQYYSLRTIYPVELWRVASALAVGEASFPVKLAQGYAVVQLLGRVKAGTTAPVDMVKDEVRQRMRIMRDNLRYHELLGTLRKRYSVEVHSEARLPVDTSGAQTHE